MLFECVHLLNHFGFLQINEFNCYKLKEIPFINRVMPNRPLSEQAGIKLEKFQCAYPQRNLFILNFVFLLFSAVTS